MGEYQELLNRFVHGWQTWNNESVLSQVYMPEGLAVSLQMVDYTTNMILKNALVGQKRDEDPHVFPHAHSYDNSYSSVSFDWLDNSVEVVSATDGDDLCVLVIPTRIPEKPSALIVAAQSLWNYSGTMEKVGERLILKKDSTSISVYTTGADAGVLFCESVTPYLSVMLTEPIGICTGKKRTVDEIRKVISEKRAKGEENKASYRAHSEAYNAMQTCLAWDTIFDPEEGTPITTVSRNWNSGWGGYVLFCWDTYFASLMQSLDNKELAYINAIRITNTATGRGFVPNYACQNGIRSFDRSQPPVGSMVAKMIYDRWQEKWFLREVYGNLLRWNEWFYENRRTDSGLLAWGSDEYQKNEKTHAKAMGVHEWQGAAYESGLDNSPMFDDIPFDEKKNILCMEDVGLMGLYIKDCYSLSEIAGILGDSKTAEKLTSRAHEMETRLETLWDEETGLYLNRRTDTGEFQHRLSPFHFHALFSKRVGQERARRMTDEHFYNPDEFYGEYILPSIARNDPAFHDQDYWRGRIWAPMNFLCYMALCEYDLPDARKDLKEKSEKLILKEWLEKGHVHENYDPDTGEGCNSQKSDSFYHWGALLSYIALIDVPEQVSGFPKERELVSN
ncbi:MAG: hypothetical protein LUE20_01485 [Oscillospiraceae bacterium]|nr:hypothetical protein [Oscillospiraceae bacterium]